MKLKFFTLTAVTALLFTGMSSCVRCIVCKDADKETKFKVCDKDYDKDDVDDAIEFQENLGNKCSATQEIY